MRLSSGTPSGSVTEQVFTLGGIPGVVWIPTDALGTRPLILTGHVDGLRASASRSSPRNPARGTGHSAGVVPGPVGLVLRDQRLALFDDFAATEKTLHANPGNHGDLPSFEKDSALWFLTWHLNKAGGR